MTAHIPAWEQSAFAAYHGKLIKRSARSAELVTQPRPARSAVVTQTARSAVVTVVTQTARSAVVTQTVRSP